MNRPGVVHFKRPLTFNDYYGEFVHGTSKFTTPGGELWTRVSIGNMYHGPEEDRFLGNAKGVDKWWSNTGRELIADKHGELEKRVQYAATYNFAKKQGIWGSHAHLDSDPYVARGERNSPYEKAK